MLLWMFDMDLVWDIPVKKETSVTYGRLTYGVAMDRSK